MKTSQSKTSFEQISREVGEKNMEILKKWMS